MSEEEFKIDETALEAMNQKAIQNQFFTPDYCYIELSLFKDLPLGVIYLDNLILNPDKDTFDKNQALLLDIIPSYQKRLFDTVEPYLLPLGYDDAKIDAAIADPTHHDKLFLVAPATKFLYALARHTVRNQNNSLPAAKYTKEEVAKDQYRIKPVDVTYRINTHPLTLSKKVMEDLGQTLGESLGVNIEFMNKNPELFDQTDWDEWLSKIDCFYFDSLGRFVNSPFVNKKQGEMAFSGTFFFVRKRFERRVRHEEHAADFDTQIALIAATMSNLSEFDWIQNNDTRLTDEVEDVPMTDDQLDPDRDQNSETPS